MVKKNRLNEYGYIIAVICSSVLIAVLLFVVAGRPLYASLKKTNEELEGKKMVLEKLESNLQNLKSLESKKTEIEQKNEKVLSALPTDKDVPRLFIQMEKIAAGAGLKIISISEDSGDTTAAETTSSNTITSHTYRVSGDANNYSSLKQALKKIEDGLRIVSIERLDAQSTDSGKSITVNFIVKTFSRGE